MIAHRLSTMMHADRIYVLERGNIVESGQTRRTSRIKRTLLRNVETADW